jgi:hypothetical protein
MGFVGGIGAGSNNQKTEIPRNNFLDRLSVRWFPGHRRIPLAAFRCGGVKYGSGLNKIKAQKRLGTSNSVHAEIQ